MNRLLVHFIYIHTHVHLHMLIYTFWNRHKPLANISICSASSWPTSMWWVDVQYGFKLSLNGSINRYQQPLIICNCPLSKEPHPSYKQKRQLLQEKVIHSYISYLQSETNRQYFKESQKHTHSQYSDLRGTTVHFILTVSFNWFRKTQI